MMHDEMLQLIQSSGLDIILVYENKRRYVYSLCINGRFQCDALEFTQDSFDKMAVEDAQKAIDVSKADMLRAANTKSGALSDSEDVKEAKKAKRKIAVKKDNVNDNDADRYLKRMRSRGNRLAKTVKYG